MFKVEEVGEYYDSTQNHYEKWWDLSKSLSLHYGIWNNGVKNFRQASSNTNKILMELSNIKDNEHILDAGCGVGGAAIFLSKRKNVKVTGITLSKKQMSYAQDLITKEGLTNRVDFHLMDYTNTTFQSESFDVEYSLGEYES